MIKKTLFKNSNAQRVINNYERKRSDRIRTNQSKKIKKQ